jgi:hypothetical protein
VIDLTPFCGTDPNRPALHEPFNYLDRTVATNGAVFVHVPRRADVSLAAPVNVNSFMAASECADMRPLPLRRLPPLRFAIYYLRGPLAGEDYVRALVQVSGDIDGAPYDLFYIHLLFSLEGLRIGRQAAPGAPLPFSADGDVRGLLMPLSGPCPVHYANLVERPL